MVHMCLEREKINEQITILNYEENSIRLSLALNDEKPIIYPGCRCLLHLSYPGWCTGFMTIKGNLSCNEAKNMSEDWRSCESFAKIFHLSPCLTS